MSTELSIEETAKRLGITSAALRKRIDRGKFNRPIKRHGRSIVVLWDDESVSSEDSIEDKPHVEDVSETVQTVDTSSVAVGMAMQTAIAQAVKDAMAPLLAENAELKQEIRNLTHAFQEVMVWQREQAAAMERHRPWWKFWDK